ncbi:hypothetical protein [Aliivibrio logei]|uniref:Uncharacterized protein n=1 Tax=Aliivibrio logei TaxID=688 RepID=A0A1B9NW06_ALILO|nr:hypothetical protein [Aliivibrio logei]OCH19088.1 hypothetical protein A6E04_16890 [Aliivibrio logei]
MDVIQLLPILGSLTSAIAVLISYLNLRQKTKSEKEQIEKLKSELDRKLSELDKKNFAKLRNSIVHGGNVDKDELENTRKIIVSIIQELHDKELEQLNSALTQSSKDGKMRYTDKLITMTTLKSKT